jgi:predicted nucleic acid-binding protein
VFVVDTSVWVYATTQGVDVEELAGADDIAVCPPVVYEFLRGTADNARYELARQMFYNLVILDAPTPLQRYEEAARLYMTCRAAGVTVRKALDCLIAATALAHNATVLHRDSDFDHIARVTALKTKRA